MKKFLLLFTLFLAVSFTMSAQSKKLHRNNSPQPAPMTKKNMTGLEQSSVQEATVPGAINYPFNFENQVFFRSETEQIIGETIYDLQTNNTCQNRLARATDGNMSATWTYGADAAGGYPDRGTGYNHTTDNAWGVFSEMRLEASTRTGWPSISKLADGSDIIINHSGDFIPQILKNGSGTWVQTSIPSQVAIGSLWPRSATGGPDGNSVHAMTISTPIANGGALYEGVDGQILYHRSKDGGDTWDLVDVIISGMDSTAYAAMNADSYYITARGETVVIALFSSFGDTKVAISYDNGDSWELHTVVDFPIDQYATDQGYTVEDIGGVDPNGPGANEGASAADSLSIFTSDNSGTVIIDNNGMPHVWFGEMYVADQVLTDGNTSFYPTWSGIRYWNLTFGQDSTQLIGDVSDLNGNDTLDIVGGNEVIAGYFASLTSFFSAGVDAENNILLAYSGLAEGYFNDEDGQYYRHLFAIGSTDGGETWSDAYDITNPELSIEPDLVGFAEVVFPSVADEMDENFAHITYQLDFRPGLSARGDMDPASGNFIMYLALNKSVVGLPTSTKEVLAPETVEVELFPNPTNQEVTIQYELTEATDVEVEIVNMMGQTVLAVQEGRRFVGKQAIQLNLNRLSPGMYLVKMKMGNQVATKKLVIE